MGDDGEGGRVRLGSPGSGQDGGQASKAKHWTPLKLVTERQPGLGMVPAPAFGVVVPLVPGATFSEPGHRRGLKRKGLAGLTC